MLERKNRKKVIIGNWKMNPGSFAEAKKLFTGISKKKITTKNTTVVVCPPFVYLNELSKGYKGKVFFGVQNVHFEEGGAFTGEVSLSQVKDVKARFVILGHSERRVMGETDELISKKIKASLVAGMHTVLCIGEKERDNDGGHLKFLEEQLTASLSGVSKKLSENLIIAYEPVWAIGKGGSAMMPDEIAKTTLFIRKIISQIFGRNIAQEISVIYGGSVDTTNAKDIIEKGHVDGLLLGRVSLNTDSFVSVINSLSVDKK